jgi:hypothetical protein
MRGAGLKLVTLQRRKDYEQYILANTWLIALTTLLLYSPRA